MAIIYWKQQEAWIEANFKPLLSKNYLVIKADKWM